DGVAADPERGVLRVEEVELRRRMPLADADARARAPAERPRRLGLALAVHRDRVVRRRGAEEVAPLGLRRVAVVPRIDQARLAENRALNAEEIRVAVAAADRTSERPDVDDHLVGIALPAITENRIAARRKHPGRQPRRRSRAHTVERALAVRPEQP